MAIGWAGCPSIISRRTEMNASRAGEIHLSLCQTTWVAMSSSGPAQRRGTSRFRASCSATTISGRSARPIPSEAHSLIASTLENSMTFPGQIFISARVSFQTMLLTEAGCSYRKKLDETLALMNICPGNVIEFSSVEAIKECASLGMGLALLPEIVVAEQLARKRLVPLRWAGPELDIATHVVWHKDKWISPALEAFISVLREMMEGQPAQPIAIRRRAAS